MDAIVKRSALSSLYRDDADNPCYTAIVKLLEPMGSVTLLGTDTQKTTQKYQIKLSISCRKYLDTREYKTLLNVFSRIASGHL